MREELSLVRKFLPHLALTKSVLSAQHDLLDVIFHHSCFPFFRDLRRRQGRLRFTDGIRGLRRPLGKWAQVHHLHHPGGHEMPRQQTTRRKVLQGGHGA